MRETLVRLLGILLVTTGVAEHWTLSVQIVGSGMDGHLDPWSVSLLDVLLAPFRGVLIVSSSAPFLMGVGILLCLASGPISRWLAPSRQR